MDILFVNAGLSTHSETSYHLCGLPDFDNVSNWFEMHQFVGDKSVSMVPQANHYYPTCTTNIFCSKYGSLQHSGLVKCLAT